MTERLAGNWIQGFLMYTSQSESPDSYLTWAAISTLSAAMRRRTWVRWGYTNIYPNMYVVLIGPPATVHKSSTIAFTRKFLMNAGIATTSDAISKEGLIAQMMERRTPEATPITVLASELLSFLAVSKESMIEFLTDIYDCPSMWEYTTRGRSTELLEKPYLTLLGALTPGGMATSFDDQFVETGFASRVIFIHETQPRFRKARMEISPEMLAMRDALEEDLARIASLEGEFQWEESAWNWFEHWYEKVLPDNFLDYRLEGYVGRKPVHVMSLAMILAVSEGDELILTERYLKTALELLEALEPSMVKAFSSVGRNPHANDLERIWQDIITSGGMSKSEIVRRNYHAMGKMQLEETIENLIMMGAISNTVSHKGDIWYHPTE